MTIFLLRMWCTWIFQLVLIHIPCCHSPDRISRLARYFWVILLQFDQIVYFFWLKLFRTRNWVINMSKESLKFWIHWLYTLSWTMLKLIPISRDKMWRHGRIIFSSWTTFFIFRIHSGCFGLLIYLKTPSRIQAMITKTLRNFILLKHRYYFLLFDLLS